MSLTVVIPTYNRGQVLLDTISMLLKQNDRVDEIIIVDQTRYVNHDPIFQTLKSYEKNGDIRFIQRQQPSIPIAMNVGLLLAQSDFVLFLDDDINIKPDFIEQHRTVIQEHSGLAHVGQVLQPNEEPGLLDPSYRPGQGLYQDLNFPFSSSKPALIKNCMAGNLCVNRLKALEVGGFDENFIGVAYRFETEFCRRMCRYHNDDFYFSPKPVLYHLQSPTGGTRNSDHFLTSSSLRHSVGDYYYALSEGVMSESLLYCCKRFLSSIKAKFYLQEPWYIPQRLFAEARGWMKAWSLYRQGPKYCSKKSLGDL